MIRPYLPSDREQLVNLWSRVFKDPPELVENFYEQLHIWAAAVWRKRRAKSWAWRT